MTVIRTMERHHEALLLWRRQDARNLRVVHLDFHCDMRGMLVNRAEGRAHRIRDRYPELDQGNFLAHAVEEGRVDAIRWVHDVPGGRADDIGTVRFESDLSAIPHRIALALRDDPGHPLDYEVVTSAEWTGLRDGELLDIDWDYFASLEYDPDTIPGRIERFWESVGGQTPREITICYSPEYSHDTRAGFAAFVEQLADRYDAEVDDLPKPTSDKRKTGSVRSAVPSGAWSVARTAYRRTLRTLKHLGLS